MDYETVSCGACRCGYLRAAMPSAGLMPQLPSNDRVVTTSVISASACTEWCLDSCLTRHPRPRRLARMYMSLYMTPQLAGSGATPFCCRRCAAACPMKSPVLWKHTRFPLASRTASPMLES